MLGAGLLAAQAKEQGGDAVRDVGEDRRVPVPAQPALITRYERAIAGSRDVEEAPEKLQSTTGRDGTRPDVFEVELVELGEVADEGLSRPVVLIEQL